LAHQDFPYAQVIAALELPHDPSRAQLCQVLFGFDESNDDVLTLPGLTLEGFPMPIPTMPYDLLVYAGVRGTGMWTRFNYDTALFTPATVAGWMHEFERILRAAAADPDARLAGVHRPAEGNAWTAT
jgi:surfactin family lipopeptide synthetase A